MSFVRALLASTHKYTHSGWKKFETIILIGIIALQYYAYNVQYT